MSNWVKVRAEEIRRAEQEKKSAGERQIAAAAELKAKLAPFWSELLAVLDETVKVFNSEFSEAERRIESVDRLASSILIRRSAYPAAVVKVTLNNSGTAAQWAISRTARRGSNAVESQGNYVFALVNGQAGYGEGGPSSHQDVAKLVLEPFFEF